MNDMSSVIVPKSDQVNAEDFIAGPRTYEIEGVSISPGTEQPVSIKLVGEPRVFRPCKSMSRVLVGGWGPDARAYVGRSITLYRDPKVKWGGLEVGGIRISHMSHIERDMVMSLTATKGKRAPHQVKVLQGAQGRSGTSQYSNSDAAERWTADHIGFVQGASSLERLAAVQASGERAMAKLEASNAILHQRVSDAYDKRTAELLGADDPFALPDHAATDRGESTTLESAKAEIDAAELVPDVNSRVTALAPLLSEEDADALRQHAMNRIAALKGGE